MSPPILMGGHIIEGAGLGTPLLDPGVPANGTSEVQTLTITGTPTGGTFKLAFEGFQTADIAFDADAAAVDAALEALPTIGTGGVTCGGGALPGTPVTITFAGNLAKKAVPLVTVAENALTGGTTPEAAVAETTPGVDAAFRSAPTGAVAVNTANGARYRNTSTTTQQPAWTTP